MARREEDKGTAFDHFAMRLHGMIEAGEGRDFCASFARVSLGSPRARVFYNQAPAASLSDLKGRWDDSESFAKAMRELKDDPDVIEAREAMMQQLKKAYGGEGKDSK